LRLLLLLLLVLLLLLLPLGLSSVIFSLLLVQLLL
jgi:hypothetical protein